MRNFMGKHKLQIETSNQWTVTPSCQHDEMIMKVLINKGVSNKYKQYHINACRMYLQVATISDISTADGTGIRHEIMDCTRIAQSNSRWEWPQQPEPTAMQKQDWQEALSKHFLTQGSKKLLQLKQRATGALEQGILYGMGYQYPYIYSRVEGIWSTHRNISRQLTRLKFDTSTAGHTTKRRPATNREQSLRSSLDRTHSIQVEAGHGATSQYNTRDLPSYNQGPPGISHKTSGTSSLFQLGKRQAPQASQTGGCNDKDSDRRIYAGR